MTFKSILICSALSIGAQFCTNAQTIVPPNIDFETGTTANWNYTAGKIIAVHTYTMAPCSATPGLHTITSGTGTDAYGGFPVVGTGTHSLKLAHDTIDFNADAAAYFLRIPPTGSFNFNYSYAAVLQNAAHAPANLPVFELNVFDSMAPLTPISALGMFVVPNSTGFVQSTVDTTVHYKGWTNGTINFTGYAGHTMIVSFTVGSCSSGGAHFGYAYIDATSLTANASTSVSNSSVSANGSFNIFPNPSSGNINIQWANQSTGNADVDVYDMTGRKMGNFQLAMNEATGQKEINLNYLNDGMYMLNIRSQTMNYSGRVVIQK